MTEATVEEFAVGRCRECEREALAIPDLDDEGTWRCAHCDERLGETRLIGGAELAALGYEITNGEIRSTGCTSCVSGGCGVPGRANS